MKLKFKHQKFQEEAAKAVCDVLRAALFVGNQLPDRQGRHKGQGEIYDFTGFKNHKIVPQLTDEMILENIRRFNGCTRSRHRRRWKDVQPDHRDGDGYGKDLYLHQDDVRA